MKDWVIFCWMIAIIIWAIDSLRDGDYLFGISQILLFINLGLYSLENYVNKEKKVQKR